MLMRVLMLMRALMLMPGHYVRTTITLREDLYQKLRRSPKGISETVNEVLDEKFGRGGKWDAMFGSVPELTRKDIREARDHRDRDY